MNFKVLGSKWSLVEEQGPPSGTVPPAAGRANRTVERRKTNSALGIASWYIILGV